MANDGLLELVNKERAKYGRTALSNRELKDALSRMEEIPTIERFTSFGSRWWLREWVSVNYE